MLMLIMLSGVDGQVSAGDVWGVICGGAGLWAATFAVGAIYAFSPLPVSRAVVRGARLVIASGLLVCLWYLVGAGLPGVPAMILIGLQVVIAVPTYVRLPGLG